MDYRIGREPTPKSAIRRARPPVEKSDGVSDHGGGHGVDR